MKLHFHKFKIYSKCSCSGLSNSKIWVESFPILCIKHKNNVFLFLILGDYLKILHYQNRNGRKCKSLLWFQNWIPWEHTEKQMLFIAVNSAVYIDGCCDWVKWVRRKLIKISFCTYLNFITWLLLHLNMITIKYDMMMMMVYHKMHVSNINKNPLTYRIKQRYVNFRQEIQYNFLHPGYVN